VAAAVLLVIMLTSGAAPLILHPQPDQTDKVSQRVSVYPTRSPVINTVGAAFGHKTCIMPDSKANAEFTIFVNEKDN
jgi:hypothetical protein